MGEEGKPLRYTMQLIRYLNPKFSIKNINLLKTKTKIHFLSISRNHFVNKKSKYNNFSKLKII